MPLGQGWLNAWVKVNNKHVVYKRGEKDGEDGPSTSHSTHSSSHSATTTSQVRHLAKSSGTISSRKTAKTAVSEDVETQTIQRVNSRKHSRRRLHRTISASDLIRDQAKTIGSKSHLETVLDVSTSTQATVERAGASGSSQKSHSVTSSSSIKHSQRLDRATTSIVEPDSPLRFVAGLLGADIEKLSLEPSRGFDGDASSRWDSVSLKSAPQTHHQLDTGSLPSRGGYSLPARAQNTHQHYPHQEHLFHRSASTDSASRGGFRFPSNIFSNDNNNNNGKCRLCTKNESELAAARDDMEYLRSVALRNEFVCSSCEADEAAKHPKETASSAASSTLDLSVRHNDRLLDEVTARQKVQLEQLTKDRQRWQHDAHVKLQKYAGLCKDLNEEATILNEDVISLHNEVDSLRLERDQMAGELETARAAIAQYERDAQERKLLEIKLEFYESKGLDEADSAIKMRDKIIEDLSTRLRKTMDVLEVEREQQRQRRQIIFPAQRPVSTDQQDLATELNSTKATLDEVRLELKSLQQTSQQRETEWTMRIENLERQLNDKAL